MKLSSYLFGPFLCIVSWIIRIIRIFINEDLELKFNVRILPHTENSSSAGGKLIQICG